MHLQRYLEAHEADAGREPANPSNQYEPDYFGNAEPHHRAAINAKVRERVLLVRVGFSDNG